MNTFVVTPVVNEEKRIGKVLSELKKTKFAVLVIDDGSKDNTFKIVSKFVNNNSRFKVLRHGVNLGKGAAMKTGAEAAFKMGADALIFMDGDGQHDISDLSKFVNKLSNYDVVFGEREIFQGVSVRIYGNRLFSFLANLLFRTDLVDYLCGYRAITSKAYQKIKWESSGYEVESEMVARVLKNNIKYTKVKGKSIYHDVFKGFTIMDAIKLLYNIVSWRLT